MDSQPSQSFSGSGGSAGYMPVPRQEMEYLCAGESHNAVIRVQWLNTHERLRRKKRDQIPRADTLQGVRASNHVQEENKTKSVPDPSLLS